MPAAISLAGEVPYFAENFGALLRTQLSRHQLLELVQVGEFDLEQRLIQFVKYTSV